MKCGADAGGDHENKSNHDQQSGNWTFEAAADAGSVGRAPYAVWFFVACLSPAVH
jgi:hypothetical protein